VSPKNGVGRHERRDLAHQPAPQAVTEFCEAPTLVIVETQPMSAKTNLQHSILFTEKRDHILPFTLAPSAQHGQDEPERRHGPQSNAEVFDRCWDTTQSRRRLTGARGEQTAVQAMSMTRILDLVLAKCRSAISLADRLRRA
jgi:hypothetical protein